MMRFSDFLMIAAGVSALAGMVVGYQSWPDGADGLPDHVHLAQVRAASSWVAAGLFGGVFLGWMSLLLGEAQETNRLLGEMVDFEYKRKAAEARAKEPGKPSFNRS